MQTHTDQKERSCTIAGALREAGWTLFGWHEDRSDSQTDYWSPAYWEGIASKGDLVAVVDAWASRSGEGIYEATTEDKGPCSVCGGSGVDPSGWTLAAARQDPRRYGRETSPPGTMNVSCLAGVVSPIPFRDDGRLRCRGNRCVDGRVLNHGRELVGHYPTFAPLPKGRKWAVERAGVVVAFGCKLKDTDAVVRKILACEASP